MAAGGTTTSSTVVSAACNATHMTTGSRLALPGGRAAWLATHTASQQREWPQSTSSRLPHRSTAEPSTSMGAAFKTHCQRRWGQRSRHIASDGQLDSNDRETNSRCNPALLQSSCFFGHHSHTTGISHSQLRAMQWTGGTLAIISHSCRCSIASTPSDGAPSRPGGHAWMPFEPASPRQLKAVERDLAKNED